MFLFTIILLIAFGEEKSLKELRNNRKIRVFFTEHFKLI